MAIKIRDAEDFRRLIDALANELVDANIYLQLHMDLSRAFDAFSEEINQSFTFWSLTLQAHLDAAVFRLCKIYDQHDKGLNLTSFVDTIRSNIGVFHVDRFRERLKDNPFVDSLAADAREPDPKQLGADADYVGINNPLVKRLVVVRNNFYAHRNAKDAVNAADLSVKYSLTKEEVGQLLETGMQIVNRYSSLFHAQSYSTQMVGHDDYQGVLGSVRNDLKRLQQLIEDEERRFTDRDRPR